VDGQQPQLQSRDDGEPATATAERPEQVGIVARVDAADPPVGRDHLGGEQVVGGESVRAAEPAQASAHGAADHADVG
jgi:hypothetical protein